MSNIGNRKIPLKEESNIIDLYQSGQTLQEIATKYHVDFSTISKLLQRNNISTRNASRCHRKYKINEHAFDTPFSNKTFYWYGMLITDGNVRQKKNGCYRLVLSLTESDQKHIEKFRDFLNSTSPITIVENIRGFLNCKPMARIEIYNKHIGQTVIQHGVAPRKSYNSDFKIQYEPFLNNRHFWRGTVDGDGSVSIPPSNPIPHISLSGTQNICLQFMHYVSKIAPTKASITKNNNIFSLTIGGSYAYHIIKDLYTNHTISLDRKQVIADKILNDFKDKYE